jgi:hypothetical protein
MGANAFVERVRRPEYTGENRCIPCTVTNLAIAAVVAVAVAVVWWPAAVGLLLLSVAAIYFRGYLVPYTPQLTKQYFPERVLRWFDKAPAEDVELAGEGADIDPEPVLLDARAIEVCKGGEDLCATDEFASAWREEIQRLRENGGLDDRLASVLDADPADVEVNEREEFVVVHSDGQPVARWESRAALLADMAAMPELSQRTVGWDDMDLQVRGRLLNGVRVFAERCPACDGELAFSQETVESCCRSIDVVALGCDDCGARLLEVET